jgi:hypothetical protein
MFTASVPSGSPAGRRSAGVSLTAMLRRRTEIASLRAAHTRRCALVERRSRDQASIAHDSAAWRV